MRGVQRFFLAGLLALTACGFSPIYGSHKETNTPTSDALSAVAIENIADENGQKLRNKLIDRMYFHGRPQSPIARLSVSLNSNESDLGIQKDATASLRQLTFNADYQLSDAEGVELIHGSARSIVIYSKLDAQYGTLAAQRDAYNRAITEVSEQIVNRLSLYFAETPPPAHSPAVVTPDTSWSLGLPH